MSNCFAIEALNPDRIDEDSGSPQKLFARLVFDLFRGEFPDLSYHDGGGKDGAIDLWSDSQNERCVIECKQIGIRKNQLCWEAARNSWREVKNNLERNLTLGPVKCQPQYRPWFNSNPRIVHYLYVVGCAVSPAPDRLDELQREIKNTFEGLSKKSSDLKHLKDIVVNVVDWDAIRRKLEEQPTVRFKWYRDQYPVGLRLIGAERNLTGFRKYHQENILPYYSLRIHLQHYPRKGIQDEHSLWKSLSESAPGMVISGISGVGKSRLMIELGKQATKNGWLVFEAFSNASVDAIERVARGNLSQGVLFLFDYLENLPAFRDISLRIAQLAGSGIRVRFLASARESFAKSEQIIDESIRIFLHSPEDGIDSGWWNSYRRATVTHITTHLGIESEDDFSSTIPAVAVLESALTSVKDYPAELKCAGNWTSRRLDVLYREKDVSKRSLALIAAQCPLDENSYARLTGEPRAAFKALLNSGWIEARDTGEGQTSYWVVHNYLADQIVLRWLEDDGPRGLAKTFEIREILQLSYTLGTLGSAIAAMQRIVDKVSGFGLPVFSELLQSEIAADRSIWSIYRQNILYTRLLSPMAKAHLLYRLGNYWQGVEHESWFQLEIAVLAKSMASTSTPTSELSTEERAHFDSLIVSLASADDERNMLITYGLRLLPANQRLQQIALDWLRKFSGSFGATYVIRAWLDLHLPWKVVEPLVRNWLNHFGKGIDAQFVLAAWLRSARSDGTSYFSQEMRDWCAKHETEVVAQNVYSAWLKAGGDVDSIAANVQAWLAKNQTLEEEPSFLFRRWLLAGGDASVITPYLRGWLDHHASSNSASFVYSAAVDVAELHQVVREPMLAWIGAHSTEVQAKACIVWWLKSGHERTLVAKHIRDWLASNGETLEAGEVIGKWLEAKGKLEMVLPYATAWIDLHGDSQYCSYLLQSLLKREDIPAEICDIALRWLELRGADHDAERVLSTWLGGKRDFRKIQPVVLKWCEKFPTDPDARYLYEQWLLAGADYKLLLVNIMAWLTLHDRELGAGRLLGALLRAGVPWGQYQPHLKNWTENNRRERDASHFYCAWLADSRRKPSNIQKSIKAWLDTHAEGKDAYFVLNDWLKHADASTEAVRATYDRWMTVHGKSYQAQAVRKNWEIATERERKERITKLHQKS